HGVVGEAVKRDQPLSPWARHDGFAVLGLAPGEQHARRGFEQAAEVVQRREQAVLPRRQAELAAHAVVEERRAGESARKIFPGATGDDQRIESARAAVGEIEQIDAGLRQWRTKSAPFELT